MRAALIRGAAPAAALGLILAASPGCGGSHAPTAAAVSPSPVVATATQAPTRSAPAPNAAPTPEPTPTATATPVPTPLPTLRPTPAPTRAPVATAPPTPVPSTCGAQSNPWGYTFCGGTVITSPASGFCTVFSCITNFANGRGYVMQCVDGMFSKSGGIQGSCSYHGGNSRPLYQP